MVRTTHVIWDWNGTLLDDTTASYAIVEQMRAARGMEHLGGIDRYRALFRFPVIEYYRDMGYTFETETFQDITVDFVARYAAIVDDCPLQAGAEAVLQTLRARGMRQMILSATGQARLDIEVAAHGIAHYFDAILGQPDDAAVSKAERGRIYFAQQGIDPAAMVLVGDTDHDFEVAQMIGCRCVLLDIGHQSRQRLQTLGTTVIHSLSELPALL